MTALAANPAADPHLRRTGIGGSDIAAIAGLDDYRSPLRVYYDKTDGITDDTAGEAAYWGTILEEPVAQHWARTHDLTLIAAPPFVRHAEHDWMFANVDRDIVERPDECYEGKTSGFWMARNWDDGPPAKVLVQCLWYMACADYVRAHIGVLIAGQQYRDFVIERDDDAITELIRIGAQFWERVVERRPPPADASDSTRAALAQVFPDAIPASSCVLPPDAARWLTERAAAADAEKAAKARKQHAENLLRQAIGDAEEGWLDGRKVVTLKTVAETPVPATVRSAYRRFHFVKETER